MNLIDKNELDKLVDEQFEKFLSRLILKCPDTVKAIPIEWIKSGIASSVKSVRDDYYDYIYDSCINEIEEVSKWCIIIGLILLFLSWCL